MSGTTPAGRVAFDVDEIPFSTRGAWLDLSRVTALHHRAPDVHLVSHQNGHRNGLTGVLRLRPVTADGTPVATTVSADSSVLTWSADDGAVEATFDGPDALRFRGRGLALRFEDAAEVLTPFTGTYLYEDPATGTCQFTSYETGLRYRITVLHGAVVTHDLGVTGSARRWVQPEGDTWEVAVEELTAAAAPFRSTATFDEVVTAADSRFTAYLDQHAGWRTDHTPAAATAAWVLYTSTVAPRGFLRREAVLMSKHWMDKVWSWDHCFNALALASGDTRAARDQFLTPFDHQTDLGALPDSVSHSEVLHNYVKPPIHGWTSALLHDRAELTPADSHEVYDALARWTRFWLDHRRAPGSALPYYHHGNDSGWDNSSVFDLDRVVESPDLAAFLVLQLEELDRLGTALGEETEHWRAECERIHEALLGLWDGTHFRARSVRTGALAGTTSLLTALPIVLGSRLPDDVADGLETTVRAHLTRWGLATERPDSPHYEDDGYWRGPIWAPSTVLVEHGLRAAGRTALADQVRDAFLTLCEAHGFAENFDARSGAGLRDRAYTWTASAYLLLARHRAEAERTPRPRRTS
ncbi:amylo-alpha-1,6-glucosidase [Curtobacterium sp. 9128]|uniref:amylo-alpha-1,6-glucosidase n=1 Tax=Curtobacterium sp. 9128 TaxID=1793722 RepID=UPI00119EEF21|nr:glycogen debranching protein [Curtobacterium sp. 9128]